MHLEKLLPKDHADNVMEYSKQKQVKKLFKDMVYALSIQKPENPVHFLLDYLKRPKVPAVCVLGPPMSGARFVAEELAKRYNAIFISTHDVIEKEVSRGSSNGLKARAFIERDMLVPDDIICSLIEQKLRGEGVRDRGFILEGFPATQEQLFFLQTQGIGVDHFIIANAEKASIMASVNGKEQVNSAVKRVNRFYNSIESIKLHIPRLHSIQMAGSVSDQDKDAIAGLADQMEEIVLA